jgi:hypothetical protein
MNDDERLDEQVEALFHIDGPHSRDKTIAAANSIAALVRYLNHATWAEDAIPYPSTIDSMVGSLQAAMAGLDQLVRQSTERLLLLAARSDAYDDRGGDPRETAQAAAAMLDEARVGFDSACSSLAEARKMTNRLGMDAKRAEYNRKTRKG